MTDRVCPVCHRVLEHPAEGHLAGLLVLLVFVSIGAFALGWWVGGL
jgi:hypothetical protein